MGAGNLPDPTHTLLESVIHLTSQRERDSLEISLVVTVFELVSPRKVVLYKLLHSYGKEQVVPWITFDEHGLEMRSGDFLDHKELDFPLGSRDEFVECRKKGDLVVIECECGETGCCRYLYPVKGSHDAIVGFFEVADDRFDEARRKMIGGFLGIYHNYLSILDDSERDTLTGLLNRKTFDNSLEKVVATHQLADDEKKDGVKLPRRRKFAKDWSHWLAVIDIDFFKRVNDRFGHLYGDEVLLLMARVMEQTFRQHDKLFRFGGEEFVVVLEPSSYENAKNTFERFRKNVEKYHFPQVGQVTVSIGFVRVSPNVVPATLVGHADEALYHAKHHGRNQVCSYEKLIKEGELESEHFKSEVELF